MKKISKTHTDNLVQYQYDINSAVRQKVMGHKSYCLWFTGLSGSGKSSLANIIEIKLFELGLHTFVLDGDKIRSGLCKDLSFSDIDRSENIRRVAHVSKLFVDAGIIVLSSFISPFSKDRTFAKNLISEEKFYEIYCKCPINICEARSEKGVYEKARKNKITNFTGISSAYETPKNPDLIIDTEVLTLESSAKKIMDFLLKKELLIIKAKMPRD